MFISGQETGTPESDVPKQSDVLIQALHEQGSKTGLETAPTRVDAARREEPVAAESFCLQRNLR